MLKLEPSSGCYQSRALSLVIGWFCNSGGKRGLERGLSGNHLRAEEEIEMLRLWTSERGDLRTEPRITYPLPPLPTITLPSLLQTFLPQPCYHSHILRPFQLFVKAPSICAHL